MRKVLLPALAVAASAASAASAQEATTPALDTQFDRVLAGPAGGFGSCEVAAIEHRVDVRGEKIAERAHELRGTTLRAIAD